MAKRQVFFSFEYGKDVWRASQVRNMGKVSDSSTFLDNDWEEATKRLRLGLMTRWLKDPVLSF